MDKSFLLAVGSALIFGLPLAASAYDDDPGYGPYRPWYGGEDRTYRAEGYGSDREHKPIYYRPTQRYYAKGFTVNYRYMPVFSNDLRSGQEYSSQSSNFRTEAFHIATADIPAWGAKPPRLVVPNRKTPSQSAVTSIIPKKTSSSYGAPTLLPERSGPLPSQNLDPAPTPVAPVVPAAPVAPVIPAVIPSGP